MSTYRVELLVEGPEGEADRIEQELRATLANVRTAFDVIRVADPEARVPLVPDVLSVVEVEEPRL